ncbi:MAG: ATP-binding protein [Roseovarius sp.]
MRAPVTACPQDMPRAPLFFRDFDAGAATTREVLLALRVALHGNGQAPDLVSRVEQALAEVLNNIAEHAYRGHPPGPVSLKVVALADALLIEVADHGAPLPHDLPGNPDLPPLDVTLPEMPEGGFGWPLILRQAQRVGYRRQGQINRLQLVFFG